MLDKMWSWSAGLILAALMTAIWVYPKLLAGLDVHPVLGWAEARSGWSFFDPGLRYFSGVVTALAVLLILFPRTRLIGAVAALAVSLFYFVLHNTPWLGMNVPEYQALMGALQAGRSVAEIEALGLTHDYSGHMVLTLTNMVLAFMVLAVEVTSRRKAREKAKAKTVQPKYGFA